MRPISLDALHGSLLAVDLALIYLWAGERELALEQLEALEQVPRGLAYGDLAKSPEWDSLRDEQRFQRLQIAIKQPIPILNRSEQAKK
jgi:hypothetical protein